VTLLTNIRFKKNFAWERGEGGVVFSKGLEIKLDPEITVLVGDQGSGKSTLIELIRSRLEPPQKFGSERLSSSINASTVSETLELETSLPPEKINIIAIDFEKDAARTSGGFDWGGPLDTASFLMHGNRSSHGEANKMALNMALSKLMKEFQETGAVSPTIILLDEPDAALSIASIINLHMALRSLARLGCQVIISAHNPFLLGCFQNLYSLKKKAWITYKQYLISQVILEVKNAPGSLFFAKYQPFDKLLKGFLDKEETT